MEVAFLIWGMVGGTSLLAAVLPYTVFVARRFRRRKPRAEVDPWAGWKAIKSKLEVSRKAEHEGWQEEFDRLAQALCAHSYPATSQAPTYYTCLKCRYEDPWDEPHEGCICRYELTTTLASPFPEYRVTYRRMNCKWHGVDWPINQRTDHSNRPFKGVNK